jgi:hypothetical protein
MPERWPYREEVKLMSRQARKTGCSPKANLGQNDAKLQKLSSIQIRHMQGDRTAQQARRTKSIMVWATSAENRASMR